MDDTILANRVMNRRPLVMMAVCFAFGVLLGRYVQAALIYAIAAAVMAAAAFLCYLSVQRAKRVFFLPSWMAGATCLLLAACLASNAMTVKNVPTGERISFSGHVYSEPYLNDYGSLVCLLDDARIGEESCGNIKLYVPHEMSGNLRCGDTVTAFGKLERPHGVRNPGGFDEHLYLLSEGVHYKAYAESIQITGHRVTFAVAMADARRFVSGTVDRVFEPDIAPIAKGLLLGDKRGLDKETYTAFKDTGMAHVLAVSGLHAAILIAAVYFFFRLIRLSRTPRLVATLLFIAVYACVTGLAPSIQRAAVMAGCLLLHKHVGRQPDALGSLSLAFIAALALSPLDLFMAGFQLSFGAVFGMLTLGWQMRRWLGKKLPHRLSWLGGALSASAGASAGTLPILAASFNRISLLSMVLNILMIPLASAVIVLVFICTFLGMAAAPVAAYLSYLPATLTRFMMTVIGWAADLPFMAFSVASPAWYMVAAWFALLFISSKYLVIKVRVKTALLTGMSAVVLAVLLLARPGGMYLVFLDVGQADAAFIRTEQGGEYFIDGGRPESADEVVAFATRCGIAPEAAFVSHTDADHFAGISALYQAGLLKKAYCSYQEAAAVAEALPEAEVIPLGAGDVVLLDDLTKAVVLYPGRDTDVDGANEASLVLLIEYNDHRILFTGDISGRTETAVLTGVGRVDIYKAAHHGSKFSSYRLPLSALTPEYSVVSVGANSFGHPHVWAMRSLNDYSGKVYKTIDDYAVEFYIDKNTISVKTYGDQQHG